MKPDPNDFFIIDSESKRLEMMNLPFMHINVLDRKPVVLVDDDMMDRIIGIRDSGVQLRGLFVSMNKNGTWSASYLDHDGIHHHRSDMTECRAYRWVLGYPIGRKPLTSKYSGGTPFKTHRSSKKSSKKPCKL